MLPISRLAFSKASLVFSFNCCACCRMAVIWSAISFCLGSGGMGIDILIIFLSERHCIRDHEELKAATAEMLKVVNMKRRDFEHLINE